MKSTAVWCRACNSRDEVEHLGLDGRVEARRGLVEHQQLGIGGERHRDHDALLHPARELVRIARHDGGRIRDLDLHQRLERARRGLRAGGAAQLEDLGQLAAHAQRRVERRAGVLVDHRERVAVVCAHRLAAQGEHVRARDRDAPAGDDAVGGQVASDRERDRRLAAAGLADEAVALALLDRERDRADDLAVAAAHAIGDVEIAQLERGDDRFPGSAACFQRAHASSTCCTASAIRLTATTSDAIASAGKMLSHQAKLTFWYCSEMSSPQSGVGGCAP